MSDPGFTIQGEVAARKPNRTVGPTPLYRFCYIDADATERLLAKRQVAKIAQMGFHLNGKARELDDFWAHALLAFGYSTLEASHDKVTIRASAHPDFRTYQLALHAAQQEAAQDVGRFVATMRRQDGDDFLAPGTPVTIMGRVVSKAGISPRALELRSLESRRSCEVVTANDHSLIWSARTFARPIFVVGESICDDDGKCRLLAAAVYF